MKKEKKKLKHNFNNRGYDGQAGTLLALGREEIWRLSAV
jgi:hypothetical protein